MRGCLVLLYLFTEICTVYDRPSFVYWNTFETKQSYTNSCHFIFIIIILVTAASVMGRKSLNYVCKNSCNIKRRFSGSIFWISPRITAMLPSIYIYIHTYTYTHALTRTHTHHFDFLVRDIYILWTLSIVCCKLKQYISEAESASVLRC